MERGNNNNYSDEDHGPDSSHDDNLAAYEDREEDVDPINPVDGLENHNNNLEVLDANEEEEYVDLVELSDHVVAARTKSNAIRLAEIWPDVIDVETATSRKEDVDLCASTRGDLLTEMSKDFAHSIQFPKSTAWLHGLGCIASAMTKSFSFTYYNKTKPVNLYVVTAQPPSTGKSAINELFSDPIRDAYGDINAINKPKRRKIKREIASLEKQINTTKKLDPHEAEELIDRLGAEEIKLDNYPGMEANLR